MATLKEKEELLKTMEENCPFFQQDYRSLRVSPYPNTEENIDILMTELISFFGSSNFAYGKELNKKGIWHIHAIFYSPDYDPSKFKDDLYSLLRNVIPEWDETKIGNATFSCKEKIEKGLVRAVAYSLKCKDARLGGSEQWIEFADQCKKNSYDIPQSLGDIMDDLWLSFKDNEIDEQQLWIEMVYQRANYEGQGGFTSTRYADIDAFVETFRIKKYGRDYVQRKYREKKEKISLN